MALMTAAMAAYRAGKDRQQGGAAATPASPPPFVARASQALQRRARAGRRGASRSLLGG